MIEKVKDVCKLNFSMDSYGQQNFYSKQEKQDSKFEETLKDEIDESEDKSKQNKDLSQIIDAYKINNSKAFKLRDELTR